MLHCPLMEPGLYFERHIHTAEYEFQFALWLSYLASAFALVDDFECVLSARRSLHALSHHCKISISNHPSHFVPLGYRGGNLGAFLYHLSYNTCFNCQSWTSLCRSIKVYWDAKVCTPLNTTSFQNVHRCLHLDGKQVSIIILL